MTHTGILNEVNTITSTHLTVNKKTRFRHNLSSKYLDRLSNVEMFSGKMSACAYCVTQNVLEDIYNN